METIGGISIGNIRDPKRLVVESDQAFQCTLDLQLPGGQIETVVYVANKDDVVETGQYVYEQIISGAAGEIEAFVMPEPTPESLEAGARYQRSVLLSTIDSVATNPLRWAEYNDEQKAVIAKYRQDLLDLPAQAGFPQEINWPVSPF